MKNSKASTFSLSAGLLIGVFFSSLANAVFLSSQPVQIHELFPVATQGENGITLLAFSESTGTYENLGYRVPSTWTYGGLFIPYSQAPSISPLYGNPQDINLYLPLPSPYGSGLDAVIDVNVQGEFNTLHIDQTVSSQGGGSYSEVQFSLYEGATNYNSPIWSAIVDRGISTTSALDLSLISGGDYFFRVHTIYSDVGMSTWQIAMTGVSPISIPEPQAYTIMLTGLFLLSFTTQRRKQNQV